MAMDGATDGSQQTVSRIQLDDCAFTRVYSRLIQALNWYSPPTDPFAHFLHPRSQASWTRGAGLRLSDPVTLCKLAWSLVFFTLR